MATTPRPSIRQRLLGRKNSYLSPEQSNSSAKPKLGLFKLEALSPEDAAVASQAHHDVDIIAVHGLGGDPFHTWTHRNGTLWLKDFVGAQFLGSRVYTFGYDSAFVFSRGTGTIRDFAKSLLEAIRLERTSEENKSRAIIFVCHSMGGIVVKQALIIAKNESCNYPGIANSVKAILFLGTPHQGSTTARYGEVLAQIANVFVVGTQTSRSSGRMRSELLRSLRASESGLLAIAEDFRVHTARIKIFSFVEQKSLKGLNQRIVDDHSAFIGAATERKIPMPGFDHREICRHDDVSSAGLQLILGALREGMIRETGPDTTSQVPNNTRNINDAFNPIPELHLDDIQKLGRIIRIPFERNLDFVGREDVLEQLDAEISGNSGNRQVALYGLGGTGKSQIVLQYAYRNALENPKLSIFWVFAGSRQRFEKDYAEIAKELNLDGYDNPDVDILLLVKNSLETDKHGDWMMILDNADDLSLLSGSAQESEAEASGALTDLLDYIPNCLSNGSVIFTTRSKVNALQLTSQGKTIHVSKMSADDSIALLRAKFSGEFSNEDGWEDMLTELENLPLAIVQAASFMRQNCWNVPQYMRHVREKASWSFTDILLHEFRDKHREKGATNAVLKTWVITVEQLESQYPIAADVLWRTAYLDGQNIPHYLLEYNNNPAAGEGLFASPLELEVAIGTLKAYSIVSTTTDRSTAEVTYTIHRLVQLFSRYWIQYRKESAVQIVTNAITRLCEVFPRDAVGRESWPRSAELIPHVQAVMEYQAFLSSQQSRFCDLLASAASYLSSIGNLSAAIDLVCRALAFSIESPSSEDLAMRRASLRLVSQLADYKRKGGYFEEAEADQRQLLAETIDIHGSHSPHTLRRLAALGDMLNDQGRYPEAEKALKESIGGFEDLQLGGHADALNAKKFLARNMRLVGRLDEAEQMIREVLQVIQSPDFHDKSYERSTLAQLSLILDKKRDFTEAETVNRQLIALSTERWGLEYHKTLRYMFNLGVTLKSLSRYSEALKQFSETLHLQETALGYDHEDTLHTVALAGSCLYSTGKYIEAVKYMQRVHDGYSATKGPASAQALKCANRLKKCLLKAGLTKSNTNVRQSNKLGQNETSSKQAKTSDESDNDS